MAIVIKHAGKQEYGHALKMLIAGTPGAGKTRLCSTAPNVLYAATIDAGLMSVVDRQCPFMESENTKQLEDLKNKLDASAQEREKYFGFPIDTVVVDTADGVQDMLIEERKKETKRDQLTLPDYGWLGDQMRSFTRGWMNLPLHTIFTVHLKTVEDAQTGKLMVKPGLVGGFCDEIAEYVDFAFLLRAQPRTAVIQNVATKTLERYAQTIPDMQHDWVKDRSGQLPVEFPINLVDDFDRLYKIIFSAVETIPETTSVDLTALANGLSDISKLKQPKEGQQNLLAQGVPKKETAKPVAEVAQLSMKCPECGGEIENVDQKDLSIHRHGKPMCRTCLSKYPSK